MMKNKENRRKFLKGALAIFGTSASVNLKGESKKVKMLTPDGKLVEVDQSVVQSSKTKKVTNKEIREWTNQIKT